MANITLPAGVYVDLYTVTGISTLSQLKVTNLTPNDIRLYSTVSEPTGADDHFPCLFGRGSVVNDATDTAAWAMCVSGGAIDVVEVA